MHEVSFEPSFTLKIQIAHRKCMDIMGYNTALEEEEEEEVEEEEMKMTS